MKVSKRLISHSLGENYQTEKRRDGRHESGNLITSNKGTTNKGAPYLKMLAPNPDSGIRHGDMK